MPWDVGKGLDPKRDERETSCTAGGRCRRQVWRRKTSRGAEDTLEGGRCIGRRKMRRKAEEASEAEAEFEIERRGGRGFPLQAPAVPSG